MSEEKNERAGIYVKVRMVAIDGEETSCELYDTMWDMDADRMVGLLRQVMLGLGYSPDYMKELFVKDCECDCECIEDK